MIKMKFKDYEFPCNPTAVKTEFSENIKENPLFGKSSAVYCISHNAAVITCEGSVWGESAGEFISRLHILRSSKNPGWLFLPDGNCFNAFLSAVSFLEDAKKNCVSYKITFVENCSEKDDEYNFGFTYAKKGENMFDIAFRCGKTIDALMAANDFENPFSVKEGKKVKF